MDIILNLFRSPLTIKLTSIINITLSHIDNAMEKAYYNAKLALVYYLKLQRLAIHPVFASLLHKDSSPNDLLSYVFSWKPFFLTRTKSPGSNLEHLHNVF